MKADTYDALNSLNRGFADALEGLKKLQAEGVLREEYVQDQTILAGEMLAGINSMILNKLSTRELADREHSGRCALQLRRGLKHETITSTGCAGEYTIRTIRQHPKNCTEGF